jgi:flagellar biosynthesis chaperone FliJ
MNDKIKDYKESLRKHYASHIASGAKILINMTFKEYEKIIEQQQKEIKELKFQKRPTYITIEGTAEDVHKDLEKFIIENDELKQEVEQLKGQLHQAQVKAERYENALKHILENYHNKELDDTGYAIEVQQTAKKALEGEE